ncbi:MAG: hypothetical protein OXG98_02080 [Gemmatimonadetes bacterium]|nr:hypothetical protein [Gemmatimonadota bacterium]
MISVDRDRFLDEGYLILRGMIPPRDLEVPPELTPDNWYASWTTGRIGNGRAHS